MCTHIGDSLVFIRRPVLLGLALFSCFLAGEAGTDAGTDKADSLKLLASAAPHVEQSADVRSMPFESLPPQPSGFLSWSALTGDWGGARSALNETGIGLKVLYRTDQMSNLNGGSELRSGSINHLDLMLSVDAGAAFGLDGMLLSAHVIANNGGSISKWVGDAQMVSNLEAPKLTKLYQLWINQSFAGDHLSVLLGLYDLNSEFYVTPGAGLFLNGSHGVGKELSQTGQNGPSIFPNTSLAMRVLGTFNGAYVQAAVLDGCPGTRENPLSPSFSWNADEGVLAIAEAGITSDEGEGNLRYRFAVGAWWYPPSVEVPIPNGGGYLMAEQQCFREGSGDQGLSAFVRWGIADLRVNRFRSHVGLGAVYTGLLPGRDDDRFGVALALARRNDRFGTDDPDVLERSAEMSIEMTYRIQLVPSIAIQPDFQYVIGPGCATCLDNASVLGVRLEASF
jgi:porin